MYCYCYSKCQTAVSCILIHKEANVKYPQGKIKYYEENLYCVDRKEYFDYFINHNHIIISIFVYLFIYFFKS